MAIIVSFQEDVDYTFFVFYRKVVFPALLIQICLRLAQDLDPNYWKTALLIIVAVLQNPIRTIHFGMSWPWWIVNVTTIVISFMAMSEVRDSRLAKTEAPDDPKSTGQDRPIG